jgi:hypothetical protein
MSESIIGKEFRLADDPQPLINAMESDRTTMVDSFVDEAVRFYRLLLVYPWLGIENAMRLCKGGYRVHCRLDEPNSNDYIVSIVKEVSE